MTGPCHRMAESPLQRPAVTQDMRIIDEDRELLTQALAAGGYDNAKATFFRILEEQTNWPDERMKATVGLLLKMRDEARQPATA